MRQYCCAAYRNVIAETLSLRPNSAQYSFWERTHSNMNDLLRWMLLCSLANFEIQAFRDVTADVILVDGLVAFLIAVGGERCKRF